MGAAVTVRREKSGWRGSIEVHPEELLARRKALMWCGGWCS